MKKIEYKKDFKDIYLPKTTPVIIDVPEFMFIMADGAGDPNGEEYSKAVETLYALSYAVKMKFKDLPNYYEYTVFPLEGLWYTTGGTWSFENRENWLWTSMIRQPDFITDEIFAIAKEICKKKNPNTDFDKARLMKFTEGKCVQAMHLGPYATEPETVKIMHEFMNKNNLTDVTCNVRKHHEIYLSDPRKIPPEKLKTVLRHPVE